MSFENAEAIARSGLGKFVRDLVESLHPDREIISVNQPGIALVRESLDVLQVAVPSRGADDHVGSARQTGAHIRHRRFGRGEVDHGIELPQECRRNRRTFTFASSPTTLTPWPRSLATSAIPNE